MRRLGILLILLIPFAFADAQVNININIKKPVPTKVSEWEQDPSIIQLILQNNTSNSYNNAEISVEVKDDAGNIIVDTKNNNPNIPKINIPAGPPEGSGTLMLNGGNLFDMNALTIDQSIKTTVQTTNSLPEGNYQICFTIKDQDGNIISTPSAKCSFVNISLPEPPNIVSPVDQEVQQEYPQFIWAPAGGGAGNQTVEYRLSIAPKFKGQSKTTAINVNSPLTVKKVQTTSYQYKPSDTPFDYYSDAVAYVWQVQALDMNTGKPVGKDQGKSKIGEFTLAKSLGFNLGDDTVQIDTLKNIPSIDIVTFPTTTLKGKVQWRWGDPPEKSGSTSSSGQNTQDNNLLINTDQADQQKFQTNALDKPVKDTKVKVYTTVGKRLIGTATTNGSGEFEVSFTNMGTSDDPKVLIGGKYYSIDEVIVEPQEPHFKFADNKLKTSKENGNYKIKNVYGYAKVYSYEPTVVDADTKQEISNATVEIMRWPYIYNFYPTLENELPPSSETISWQNFTYKTYKSAKSGETIKNLIINKSTQIGRYFVRVYAKGYDTLSTNVIHQGNNYSFNNKPVVKKDLELTASLPSVEGKVVRKDNLAPLSNLSVEISPKNSASPSYSTTTDQNGKFLLTNIQVSSDAYELKISGNKIKTHTEELYLNSRGIIKKRYPIKVEAVLFAVKGKVVDKNNNPIPNATLQWKDGKNTFYSDDKGNFLTMSPPGNRSLIVKKIGYLDKNKNVNVSGNTQGALDFSDAIQQIQQWSQSGGSFGNNGFNFNALGISDQTSFGNTNQLMMGQQEDQQESGSSFMFLSMNLGSYSMAPEPLDLGFVKVEKVSGKLKITVLDESSNTPVSNATVKSSGKSAKTNSKGTAYLSGVDTGPTLFRVESPSGDSYVPEEFTINIPHSTDTAKAEVKIEKGAILKGVTKAGNKKLDSVKIFVEDRKDLSTLSDAQGNYKLRGIPAGENKIKAVKQGYIGDSETMQLSKGENQQDFDLTSPDFSVDSFLGYDVELTELKKVNDTLRASGALVNLPSNLVFTPTKGMRVKFTNIKVYKHRNGLWHYGDTLKTDMTSLKVKMFDFFYGTAKNSDNEPIAVSEFTDNEGIVEAERVVLNYDKTFKAELEKNGWEFKGNVHHYVKPQSMNMQIPMLFPADSTLLDIAAGMQLESMQKDTMDFFDYNLIMDLSQSMIEEDGLHLQGFVKLDSIPKVDSIRVGIEDLWIDRNGKIRQPKLKTKQATAAIDSLFDIQINSISFSEVEAKGGGLLKFNLPKSGESKLTFSGLKFSDKRLYGGKFSMPGKGINLFNQFYFRTDKNKSLDFFYDEASKRYYLSGPGYIKASKKADNKVIETIDKMDFNNFAIKSNGGMNYKIRTDLRRDFGDVLQLEFHTFEIDTSNGGLLKGAGRAYFKNIPFTYGKSHFEFRYIAKDSTARLDSIDLKILVPTLAKVEGTGHSVDYKNKYGFEATGTISLLSGVVDGKVDFHNHIRKSDGKETVKAEFQSSIGIPIGDLNIVEADGIFFKNVKKNKWLLDINGKISTKGHSPISLDPLDLLIKKGPVINGTADVNLFNHTLLNAKVNIDKPNKFVSIKTKLDFEIIPGITPSVNTHQDLVISGKPGNKYWYALFSANASIPKLVSGNLSFAIGNNANLKKLGFKAPNTLSGVNLSDFSGAIARANINIGNTPRQVNWNKIYDKAAGQVYIKGWFYNHTKGFTFLNTEDGSVGFHIGNNWGAGGKIKAETGLLPKNNVGDNSKFTLLASASMRMRGAVAGGYSQNNGFYFNGKLNARAQVTVGECSGCGGVKICGNVIPPKFKGVTVCKDVGVDVAFSTADGLNVHLNL